MAIWQETECTLENGTNVVLRNLRPVDIPAFLKFQPQAASETTFTLQMVGKVPTPEKLKTFWEKSEQHPKALLLGAFVGERIIGSLGLHPPEPPHPWLDHSAGFGMMVLKEFWGTGVSDRLIETLHEHAKKVGISRIEGSVRVANKRGISFYKRHGYIVEGTRKKAAYINGQFEDEHYIARLS